ncbi:MAG: flagellar basal body rod protein FlgC [Terriglobales bacterium]
MSMFTALEVSGSALGAERQRAEVVAANMANAETTNTPEGGPYRRKEVVFASSGNQQFQTMLADYNGLEANAAPAVRVRQVIDDPTPPVMRYDPGHPDADKDGYVAYPAINPTEEMVDLMGAVRSYQLNASAIAATKQMIQQSISLLK